VLETDSSFRLTLYWTKLLLEQALYQCYPFTHFVSAGSLRFRGHMKKVFAMMQSIPKEFAGGEIYRADATSYPEAKGLSLQLLILQPGAIREPHIRSNAAQLDYVVFGRGRIGMVAPGGESTIVDVIAGNVVFVPQGHLSWIENVGQAELRAVLALAHERPETIELSEILAATPNEALSKAYGLADDVLSAIPTRGVVIGGKGY
jgi:oxalate decarboxylase/phosphoglucose isomerase-like protein (cupin superfamily)